MGHTLEKLFISFVVMGTVFMSCVSCVGTIRKAAVAQERVVATPGKLWPSIALVSADPVKPDGGTILATGWAIDPDHLITAGHFCEGVIEGIKLGKTKPGVKIQGSDSYGMDIEIGRATIIAYENDGAKDRCLLFLKDHGLIPLKVAADLSLVETEDPVTIAGAPRGMFPVRVDGRVWVITPEILLLAVKIAPGNSGCPVVRNGEVIGMVVSTIRPGPDVDLGAAVRSDKILEFFEAHKLVPKKAKAAEIKAKPK